MVSEPKTTKLCPRCGGVVLASAVKCTHCKRPILESTARPPTDLQAGAQSLSPPMPGSIRCSRCNATNPASALKCTSCSKPLRVVSRKFSKAVIVVASILLLVGAGVGVGVLRFYYRSSSPPSALDTSRNALGQASGKLADLVSELEDLVNAKDFDDFSYSINDKLEEFRKAIPNTPDSVLPSRESCEAALRAATSAGGKLNALVEDAREVEKPETPKLDDFLVVKHICGTFIGSYMSDPGGIVITHGREYYVIKKAEHPLFATVCGYVRDENTTLLLDNGHIANSTVLSDSVEYRQRLDSAKQDYATAIATYKKDLAAWKRSTTPYGLALRKTAENALPGARGNAKNLVLYLRRDCFFASGIHALPQPLTAYAIPPATPSPTARAIPEPATSQSPQPMAIPEPPTPVSPRPMADVSPPALPAPTPTAKTEPFKADKQVDHDQEAPTVKHRVRRSTRKVDELGF